MRGDVKDRRGWKFGKGLEMIGDGLNAAVAMVMVMVGRRGRRLFAPLSTNAINTRTTWTASSMDRICGRGSQSPQQLASPDLLTSMSLVPQGKLQNRRPWSAKMLNDIHFSEQNLEFSQFLLFFKNLGLEMCEKEIANQT